MAITITNLTSGSETNALSGFTADIASVSVPNNSVAILTIAAAGNSGSPVTNIETPVTTGLTWNLAATADYGSRRCFSVFYAINTSGSTVTAATTVGIDPGANTAQEAMWSMEKVEGIDTATPLGTVATPAASNGVTSISATVTGTPDSGDFVFAAFVHTGASSAMTLTGEVDTGITELGGGTNVRRIKTAYDATPDASPTASVSWSGTEDAAAMAFILNVGAAPAATSMQPFLPLLQRIPALRRF